MKQHTKTSELFLLLLSLFLFVNHTNAQVTCDTTGNVVLYSNYDGGVLNINVDVNIPNLKIGIVSYEMVTINVSGPFVNNITEIQFAGYTTTTHHHCGNSPAVTSIVGAPPGTDTLIFMPVSPVSNANGYNIIICNYSCDSSTNQGGCNTPDQIAAYFQQEFGGLLRYHFTQYGCWNGTYNLSDGGNCCISALTSPPAALFSSPNHICPGTCTDFTNLSSNATSYQWTFTGGNPASSNDVNPVGICYSQPGTYDVSLIATGPGGADTLTLSNYITVFPYPPPQAIQQLGDTLVANQGAASYQWYYNGNIIPGATDYFYVATQNGDYNILCIDSNGCEVESVIFNVITVISNLSSGENRLEIYPDPVVDMIYIKFTTSIDYNNHSVLIYNMFGQKIMELSQPLFTPLNVDFLDKGIYLLEVISYKSDPISSIAEKNIQRKIFIKQ